MMQCAYLRSNEGVFTLAPKLTIIGRESCDFIIQNITVDSQQAVIEYLESEQCFVLKDLNSTHGSFVNDCLVRNATVRLSNGDILRFGFSNGQYEFHTPDPVAVEELPESAGRQSWQASTQITSLPSITGNQLNQLPPAAPLQHRYTSPAWINLPRQSAHNSSASSSNSNIKLTTRPQSASFNMNRRQLTPTAPLGHNSQLSSSANTNRSARGSISGPSRPTISDSRQIQDSVGVAILQNSFEKLKPLEQEYIDKSQEMEQLQWQNNRDLVTQSFQSSNEMWQSQINQLNIDLKQKQIEIDKLQSLLERVADNSQRLNFNSSNNEMDSNNGQRKELEKTKKDLQISYGLVTSLQKDVCSREEIIKKLKQDIDNLNHEVDEKSITISSLMSKITKFKDVEENENERRDREREVIGLRHKLSAAEIKAEEMTEKNECLRRKVEELQKLESQNSDQIRQLTEKLEKAQIDVTDLQRSESVLRVDLQDKEKKYERLHNRLMQVSIAVPGFQSTNESLKDDEMIETMQELLKSKIEHDRRICEKQRSIEDALKQRDNILSCIEKFTTQLKENFTFLTSGERVSERINETATLLKTSNTDETMENLKQVIIDNLTAESQSQAELEVCIAAAEPDLANLTLSECFKRIVERSKDATQHRKRTEEQLVTANNSYEEEISKLQKSHDEEVESKVIEAVNIERVANEEKYQKIIEEMQHNSDEAQEKSKVEFETKIKELEDSVELLKETLKSKDEQHMNTSLILQEKIIEVEKFEQQLEILQKELVDTQAIKEVLEQSNCEQIKTAELKWQSEIELYKQETTQHAITIESLNNRLHKLDKEHKELQNQLKKVRKEKKKSSPLRPIESQEIIDNIVTINNNADMANLERCIAGLRHENSSLKETIRQNEDTIKGLNMDMVGAEARLSDLKGEMSETQKTEMDKMKLEIVKLEEDLTETRVHLSKMSIIVDNLNQEIEDKKMDIKQLSQKLHESKALVKEKETKVTDLETKITNEKETWLNRINNIEQEGRVSTELATVGSQCRGERHNQIIEAQRSALSELRQKMKTLEMGKLTNMEDGSVFSDLFNMKNDDNKLLSNESDKSMDKETVFTHERVISQIKDKKSDKSSIFPRLVKTGGVSEVTQQMLQMKKEVAELRAKQALKDSAPYGMSSLNDLMASRRALGGSQPGLLALPEKSNANDEDEYRQKALQHQKEAVELQKSHQRMEFDMNVMKTTLDDVQQSFETSESSYLDLLRQLMSTLEIENVKGMRSLSNLSLDAKQQLRNEREETCGLMIQKIKILREKVQRKEELLQGYEKDLIKLRQAEDLADRTQEQMNGFIQEMRNKGEEVDLLRETLNRTKDLLNQEKRNNTAIKQHKNYVPDKPSGIGTDRSIKTEDIVKFHCPPPDLMDKEKMREKHKMDKLKRKDYEIKSLKSELYKKDKELTQVTHRLCTLETTMGIKSE